MVLANEHIYLSGIAGQIPMIRDTGIAVAAVLKLLQEGSTIDAILAQHPLLTREDIQAAIAFASDAMQRYIETLSEDAEDEEDYEESDEIILANLKQGLQEALRGEGRPIEEVWSELNDE